MDIKQRVDKSKYQVIPRTLCFLFSEELVLLIQYSSKKKDWAGKYNGIGGHIQQGESILSAARREIQEETGLTINSLCLCGTVMINTGDMPGVVLHVFGKELKTKPEIGLKHSAEGNVSWISLGDLGDLPLMEDTPTLIEYTLAVLHGDRPAFSALYSYNDQRELEITFS